MAQIYQEEGRMKRGFRAILHPVQTALTVLDGPHDALLYAPDLRIRILPATQADVTERIKNTLAPNPDNPLLKTTYGPLSAVGCPALPPEMITDMRRTLYTGTYNTLALPPQLRLVVEHMGDRLVESVKTGDRSKLTHNEWEMVDQYSQWYFRDDESDNKEERVQKLAGVMDVIGKAPRMAIGILRLATAFASPGAQDITIQQMRGYFYDEIGLSTSNATKKAKKASMQPLIIQDALPILARDLPADVSGGDLLMTINGNPNGHLFDTITSGQSGRQHEAHLTKWITRANLAALITSPAALQTLKNILDGNFSVPNLESLAQAYDLPALGLLAIAAGVAVNSFVPVVQRVIQGEDLNRPIDDITHLCDAEGTLREQLKWSFASPDTVWANGMMIDEVDMARHLANPAKTRQRLIGVAGNPHAILAQQGKIDFGASRTVVPALKNIDPTLPDVFQQTPEVQTFLEKIVPTKDRTIPLSLLMLRSNLTIATMKEVNAAKITHPPIYYPDVAVARESFTEMGTSRLKAVKGLTKSSINLSLALPAAHRVATYGLESFNMAQGSGNVFDALLFGGAGANPGSAGIEWALARSWYRTQDKVFTGSHDDGVAIVRMPNAKGPLDGLRSTFQFIGSTDNPLGVIALWATERHTAKDNGLMKDLELSFREVLVDEHGKMSEGNLDYALRLMSAAKYYESQASELTKMYPNLGAEMQRAQNNLKFFRKEIVDTIWNGFILDRKKALLEADPLMTYSLIRMFQEAPEFMGADKFADLISASGLKGNFQAPNGGVPTTWVTLYKYLEDVNVDPQTGLNIYGIDPKATQLARAEIQKTLIAGRAQDFIKSIYGFTETRTKTVPPVGSPNYESFVETINRAHTFLNKTIGIMSDEQLVTLYDTLIIEMQNVMNRVRMYARSEGSPEKSAYQFNMAKIADAALMISLQMHSRATRATAPSAVCNDKLAEEISFYNDSEKKTAINIYAFTDQFSKIYTDACNRITPGGAVSTVFR